MPPASAGRASLPRGIDYHGWIAPTWWRSQGPVSDMTSEFPGEVFDIHCLMTVHV